MTNGIDWSTVLANSGTFLVALATLLGIFWGLIKRNTRTLILENSVSVKTYREEQTKIRQDIEQLQKSDAEYRVIKNQIDSLQMGQTELKNEMQRRLSDLQTNIQDSADRQSRELSGAIDRVQRTMVEYTKAVVGK